MHSLCFLFLLFSIAFYFNVNAENPWTPKGYAVLYWKHHVSNHLPTPQFLLHKASPLTATESAYFSHLSDQNLLSTYLSSFCNKANLPCSEDRDPTIDDCIFIKYCSFKYGDTAEAERNRGKVFFREAMLKTNNVLPMMDLTDDMAQRSFLPRQIASKLPFSTSKINEIKALFHIRDNDTMIASALNACESAPMPGETKKCVASIEDMIDFATRVLGSNVVTRRMETTKGSNGNIMVGEVKRINGGRLTKAVSCHRQPFPYLVYFCHSVPKVRLYEADIFDPISKAKINHGVAICHVDTSSWSPDHMALKQFESSPGKIELCHWIYESGMIWTVAD